MLCATATAGYICRVNISTAAPLLMKEFGLTQIEMGRIFSSFLLGYAWFQVPSGAIADRFWCTKSFIIYCMALADPYRIPDCCRQGAISYKRCHFASNTYGFSLSPWNNCFPDISWISSGSFKMVLPEYQGRANGS